MTPAAISLSFDREACGRTRRESEHSKQPISDGCSAIRKMTDDGVFSCRVNLPVARDSTGIESDLFYSGGVRARILLRYWLGAAPTRRPNERLIAAALPNPQAAAICLSPRSVRSS